MHVDRKDELPAKVVLRSTGGEERHAGVCALRLVR